MLVTWLGIVMLVKFGIVFSSQSDIFVIPLPKTIDDTTLNPRIQFRLVKASGIMKLILGQPENGAKPVLIMESGRVTLVKAQLKNARYPMLFNELGLAKVTLARREHALNASSLIFVTEFGISILVNEVQL